MDAELRSLVFTEWNKAKAAARHGQLDPKRVNKALGLLLSGKYSAKFKEYGTTYRTCGCPDYIERKQFCKHKIAFIIWSRVYEKAQLLWLGEYKVIRKVR